MSAHNPWTRFEAYDAIRFSSAYFILINAFILCNAIKGYPPKNNWTRLSHDLHCVITYPYLINLTNWIQRGSVVQNLLQKQKTLQTSLKGVPLPWCVGIVCVPAQLSFLNFRFILTKPLHHKGKQSAQGIAVTQKTPAVTQPQLSEKYLTQHVCKHSLTALSPSTNK